MGIKMLSKNGVNTHGRAAGQWWCVRSDVKIWIGMSNKGQCLTLNRWWDDVRWKWLNFQWKFLWWNPWGSGFSLDVPIRMLRAAISGSFTGCGACGWSLWNNSQTCKQHDWQTWLLIWTIFRQENCEQKKLIILKIDLIETTQLLRVESNTHHRTVRCKNDELTVIGTM